MLYNTNKSDQFTNFASKAIMKLSKLFLEFQRQDISFIDDSELPPSTILLRELSKPVLDPKKLNQIIKKGVFPKIKKSKEERNIKLILDTIKRYKGYEQFIILHKICEKNIIIMSALGIIEKYKKGEMIYAKKDVADKFYFIIKGKVLIKALDQKKVIDEYENKIQDYKNKNINDFHNTCSNNIQIIKNSKNTSQINSNNSITNSIYNFDNSNSSSILSKDLLQNKIQNSEKEKYSTSLQKHSIIKENIFENRKNLDEVNITKRRKPLFYINNEYNNNGNNIYNNIIKDNIKKDNNNINNEKNDIYIQSLTELQNILNEQREHGITINEFKEGNFFGEWELMYKKLRQNTAYAIEDTDLLIVDSAHFKDFFKNEMLLADFERKFFIKKIIPILNINYMPIMIPIFYSKGDIVYTEYDFANYFYIIYKGSGALKQLKNAKNKKDIMLNLTKLETLMFIDRGCIVGLECSKNINNKEMGNALYDNTFVINEENTLVYKINFDRFKINKEEKFKLKKWMKDLYNKQSKLIKNCKEKLFKPKINREMLIKNIDNKNKKILYYRDPKKNMLKNKNSKNNDFPVKKKSIHININASFNQNIISTFNKENISKFISNYKSYSKRGSVSNVDSSSGFSYNNSKEKSKSSQRSSRYYIYNTINPFSLNDELISDKKSFNPINTRNYQECDLNPIYGNNTNVFTVSSNDNKISEISNFSNRIKRLRNCKTKQKNNESKNSTYRSLKKLKYDDSFYKLIFKKHYRKVSISSGKKECNKINLVLYDSGQFDIPLLAFGSKKKKIKKLSC